MSDNTATEHAAPPAACEPGVWKWLDWACLVFLLVATVVARYRALNPIPANPDEAEYEALAAYCSSSGVSVFSVPIPYSYTAFVYKLVGPYQLTRVRVVVLLIVYALEVLLFLVVRKSTNRWAGLLSACVLLLVNPFFEGVSANREWFASLPVFLGIYLVLSARDPAPAWRAFAGGFSCCVGLWFKEQALPMAAVVPLVLAAEALTTGQYRSRILTVLVFTLGGLAGAACYLIPFAIEGRLAAHLHTQVQFVKDYGLGKMSTGRTLGVWEYYYGHYFLGMGFHWLMRLVYLTALVIFGRMVLRLFRRPLGASFADERGPRLMALYLLSAAVAVGAGNRFFSHYYLFLLVPVSALYAFGTYGIVRLVEAVVSGQWFGPFKGSAGSARRLVMDGSRLASLLTALVLVLPVADLATTIPLVGAGLPQREGSSTSPQPPGMAAFLSQLASSDWRYSRLFMENFVTYPDQAAQEAIEAGWYLKPRLQAGDTLFVWGWQPQIYSAAQTPPATFFVTCNPIARDFTRGTGVKNIDRKALAQLIRQLNDRQPRFIVDASKSSYSISDASHAMSNLTRRASDSNNLYSLQFYPEFADFLRKHYQFWDDYGEFRIYRRMARW